MLTTPAAGSSDTRTRNDAIDLARGTAVLFMPLVHSLYMYGDRVIFEEEGWFCHVMHVLGHGAPMFLFAMGFSFVFSRHQSPSSSSQRGLRLMLVGYVTHWILISWGMGVVGFREQQVPAVAALSVVVLVATLVVEAAYRAARASLGALLAASRAPRPSMR